MGGRPMLLTGSQKLSEKTSIQKASRRASKVLPLRLGFQAVNLKLVIVSRQVQPGKRDPDFLREIRGTYNATERVT